MPGNNTDAEYLAGLENFVRQMLRPIKDEGFDTIMKCMTGYRVLPFDENNASHVKTLKLLKKIAVKSCEIINGGVSKDRVNEVGNSIEDIVKYAFNSEGLYCDKPDTVDGSKKSSGYPDLEFRDEDGVFNYLECKTYNLKTLNQTFRTFYVSPSENPKITRDAIHYLISFEMYETSNKIYKARSWKILSLSNLKVDLKHEFNASNKDLYSGNLTLAEGTV